MKVSIARIRLFLKEGKTLSDGSHPIMLMCSFNGKCTRSTHYSCSVRYWDKKGECVKKGYPNWVMINAELSRLKSEAIAVRNGFEQRGEHYTASMVLDGMHKKELSCVGNDLSSIIRSYIEYKALGDKTCDKLWCIKRSIERFKGGEVVINEVDESLCRRYAKWLVGEGFKDVSIRNYLSSLGGLCTYAISQGIMQKHPFENWKFYKTYRESKREEYIHHRSMEFLIEMFLSEVIDKNGSRWSYKEDALEKLLDVKSSLYALYLYILGYHFCGLAPIDISMLKKEDIKSVQIKGVGYYAIDGQRMKTRMPYRIRIEQNTLLSNVLIKTMLMFNEGEYFVPTLKGYRGKLLNNRVNYVYQYHCSNHHHLEEWFRKCNDVIIRHNVENRDNVELIDVGCTYYSYRHSYVMKELNRSDVNILRLSQQLGKSPRSLHEYVSMLSDDGLV